eukprot:1148597-Pelagomonas_calceolata.AAC.2
MQDLCLDLSKQLCILGFWGLPRVWGQKSGEIPAKMGSPGSGPPACLTSSDGWALHQEQSWGFWGAGMGVRKIAPGTSIWQEKWRVFTPDNAPSGIASLLPDQIKNGPLEMRTELHI